MKRDDISIENRKYENLKQQPKNEDNQKKKSIGTIIDELLNNPEVIMVQAGKMIKEAKDEANKVINENKELKEKLTEKDKQIAFFIGKIDALESVIKELNAPIEVECEKENQN